ncbi:uncharacterized protein [Palaemon carinicauda]|uniref:uncharacterized protein n=1 Tax=Palaemon carinicauda TaxID=392227 RepID=UPI0035B5DC6E
MQDGTDDNRSNFIPITAKQKSSSIQRTPIRIRRHRALGQSKVLPEPVTPALRRDPPAYGAPYGYRSSSLEPRGERPAYRPSTAPPRQAEASADGGEASPSEDSAYRRVAWTLNKAARSNIAQEFAEEKVSGKEIWSNSDSSRYTSSDTSNNKSSFTSSDSSSYTSSNTSCYSSSDISSYRSSYTSSDSSSDTSSYISSSTSCYTGSDTSSYDSSDTSSYDSSSYGSSDTISYDSSRDTSCYTSSDSSSDSSSYGSSDTSSYNRRNTSIYSSSDTSRL